jgi:hypothetical protein
MHRRVDNSWNMKFHSTSSSHNGISWVFHLRYGFFSSRYAIAVYTFRFEMYCKWWWEEKSLLVGASWYLRSSFVCYHQSRDVIDGSPRRFSRRVYFRERSSSHSCDKALFEYFVLRSLSFPSFCNFIGFAVFMNITIFTMYVCWFRRKFILYRCYSGGSRNGGKYLFSFVYGLAS